MTQPLLVRRRSVPVYHCAFKEARMPRRFAFVVVLVLGVVVTAHVWAEPSWKPQSKAFTGYWMGIDPLDGGDSRRSLVRLTNGRYAMAGRDSALTLCDGTDRGFISFDDGIAGKNVLRTDSLTIACTNSGASVVLRVRYELFGEDLMIEETTTLTGAPVTRIVFHKVGGGAHRADFD
jgi:hypothetical protein